jgi:Ca2+-binding RTX toxin-like protein
MKRGIYAGVPALALALFGAPAAHADSCTYDAATKTVTALHDGQFGMGLVREGKAIAAVLADGAHRPCGAATVRNTDTILFDDPNGGFDGISLTGGAFAPGATPEPRGKSEIEIHYLGHGKGALFVTGAFGRNTFVVGAGAAPAPGAAAINLDGDDDADVSVEGVVHLELSGGSQADTMSGAGGAGTGGAERVGAWLNGSDGNDRLIAGAAPTRLHGDAGNDRLVAANGVVDVGVDGGDGTDRAALDCALGDPATSIERTTCV